MVLVPGVPQIKQLHEIFRRALDMGWTWGLIPLEYHGQSSKQENAANHLQVPNDPTEGGVLGKLMNVTMLSHEQYHTQVRSQDLAQLDERDLTPMILRSLAANWPFSRMPLLSPPDPVVQERMFLHGMLDMKGVTQVGYAVAAMDLPCDWAQFLYTCDGDLKIAP